MMTFKELTDFTQEVSKMSNAEINTLPRNLRKHAKEIKRHLIRFEREHKRLSKLVEEDPKCGLRKKLKRR